VQIPAPLEDLHGRVAVVTGANSGLGLHTAAALAGAGAHVVMTARDPARGQQAVATVREQHPDASLEVVQLDLADLASVRACAALVVATHDRVDVLVNNAGVMQTPLRTTADGIELQLGTNHVGHFALTGLLLDALLACDETRVVTVSSGMHHLGRLDLPADAIPRDTVPANYSPTRAYGRSKLANLVFALELQRRLIQAGVGSVRSLAAHPGYAATNLQTSGPGMHRSVHYRAYATLAPLLNRFVAAPAEEGAAAQVFAAAGPGVPGGTYWGPTGPAEARGPVGPARISDRARDPEAGRRLWAASVSLSDVEWLV